MPKRIPADEIPNLPVQVISGDELLSFGIADNGLIVHYLERDTCLMFTWDELLVYCVGFVKKDTTKPSEPVAISKPTERG